MRTAYFDASHGASGDMFLGALVDAGCPLGSIEEGLRALPTAPCSLGARQVARGAVRCTRVEVSVPEGPSWTLRQVEEILGAGRIPEAARERAGRVFRRRSEAEARLRGLDAETIPCHDPDGLVDVVGTAIGLAALDVDRAFASPLRLGSMDPVALEISRGWPVLAGGPPRELTTPTGAALVTTLAKPGENAPPLSVESIGYGAGSWDGPEWPNYFRLWIGSSCSWEQDQVWELATNLDNFNPEGTEHLFERLFSAGALDVHLTPVQMKKSRPGTLVTVLADAARLTAVERVLFEETPTLGIRRTLALREKLPRRWETVETRFGPVRIKIGRIDEGREKHAPEYEDLRMLAARHGVPLAAVREEALRRFERENDGSR